MCGIAGSLSRSANVPIGPMVDTMVHRGPDDSGVWMDANAGVALGHRRLSILDLSRAGHQPMKSASGRYVISYNGEIYNYLDVLRELGEHGEKPKLRGHSDTEVILAAFERWGIAEAVPRFNGMFAMAVWDAQERVLWLGRDPFGEKPLYYGWIGETFLFGSELKALQAHPVFDGSLDRNALALYLRFNCVPSPHSIYKKLKKLPAASLMRVSLRDIGRAEPYQYWSLEDVAKRGSQDPFRGSLEDAIEQLDQLLRDAVKMRTISDVPLGVFLSGGIDSSLITALMQAQHGGPVRTFSVGLDDETLDESRYAERVATHLGTEHSALRVTPADAMAVLPELARIYDEPFSDSSQIPTLLVSRFARRSVTVALSGDGGDEIFGGYNRHVWIAQLWKRIGWLPTSARRAVAGSIRAVSPQAWDRWYDLVSPLIPSRKQFATPGYKIHKLASVMIENGPRQMYGRLLAHWPNADRIVIGAQTGIEGGQRIEGFGLAELMMLLDAQQYLHDDILVKVDRAGMSASLETRAPYLDPQVAGFAWRLPLGWKIHGGMGKWILRQVLYRYVPRELVDRPKRGFGIPLDHWLRFELRDWAESLLEPSRLRQEGYLEPAPIREKWDEHLSGRRNWAFELWDILMFQEWLENSRNPVPSTLGQLVG